MKSKVVLVTGASRGLGRSIALAFARKGSRLVLAARSAGRLAQVEKEIQSLGAEAISIPTDVSQPDSVRNLIDTAMAAFGRIDVLVNNAGIARFGAVELPAFDDNLRQTLEASLFGMIDITRRVLPIFRQQGSGAVVNMSSVMGRKAFARFGSYAIVMHGVCAFSDALRQELAGTNIKVTVIHPGLTDTELLNDADVSQMPPPFRHMTPISPDVVANAVVKGVQNAARRVVVPRTANMLLLGEALSPMLGDLIAKALTIKSAARLLGLSRGRTFAEAQGVKA